MSPLNSMFQSSVLNFNYRQDRPYQDWNNEFMSGLKNCSKIYHCVDIEQYQRIELIEYFIHCFGWFPGVWILCADVSEHSVISIFVGGISRKKSSWLHYLWRWSWQCSETSAHKIQTPRNDPPKKEHSEQCESLKSRKIIFLLLHIEWAGKHA